MNTLTDESRSLLTHLFEDHVRIQRARTDAALHACGFESLAIYAGRPHTQFLDDQPYPFKANPHFRLWSPLPDPIDCWIVYRAAQPLRLVFLQPRDYWHKPPQTPTDYWTRFFQLIVIHDAAEARASVANLPRCAFIGEPRDEFRDWGFAGINPAALLNRLHYERAFKTPYELECMRRASVRAANGHSAAETAFRNGASEYEIHLEYLRAAGHTDNELPYPSIVALNANAAVLHYQHLERRAQRIDERYSFLIDAGAEFGGYACDVTRTYSYADDEFGALIESMHRLQLALSAQVRSGVDYASIHLDAHLRIANLLQEAGLTKVGGASAVESGLSGVFFPHGVGHLLGLQVHDVAGLMMSADGAERPRPPGHPYLRLTRTLEPGFVVTIEPGLYFIDSLLDAARTGALAHDIDWERVERFRRCGGVRIEDNVVCTEGEPENLTRTAFAVRA